jgi:uncharacterized membrane protein YfcA
MIALIILFIAAMWAGVQNALAGGGSFVTLPSLMLTGAAKDILAGVISASAVAIFVFSRDVHWPQALVTAVGASFGGWAGRLMLRRVNERLLKLAVVALGLALTIGLFWTAP